MDLRLLHRLSCGQHQMHRSLGHSLLESRIELYSSLSEYLLWPKLAYLPWRVLLHPQYLP